MSEDKKRDRKSDEAKRRFGRFWFISAIVAITCCLVWKIIVWNCRSPDEQLAAIEASLAIPDSENTGVAYTKLASEYLPLPEYPSVADKQTLILTREQPWHRNDYPKLAAWLDERQDLISKLLEISRIEKCRLPIPSDKYKMSYFTNPVRQMHGWTYLLIQSGNMDAGEDRIDTAIEKYTCVLQIGSHLRQQPVVYYYELGVATELLGLIGMEEFITQNELTEMQLTAIEMALLPAENKWKQHSRTMVKIHRIFERRRLESRRRPRITDWRRYWEYWKETSKSDDPPLLHETHRYHLFTLTNRRRMYIMVALRRYKNERSHWPQTLDSIKPLVAEEVLTDPHNNSPFVYKLTDDGFILYSKGKNNIDEAGRSKDGADDWPIWPSRSKISQSKKKDTDSKQSDTDTEKKVIE